MSSEKDVMEQKVLDVAIQAKKETTQLLLDMLGPAMRKADEALSDGSLEDAIRGTVRVSIICDSIMNGYSTAVRVFSSADGRPVTETLLMRVSSDEQEIVRKEISDRSKEIRARLESARNELGNGGGN